MFVWSLQSYKDASQTEVGKKGQELGAQVRSLAAGTDRESVACCMLIDC